VVLTWQRQFPRSGSVCGPDAGRKEMVCCQRSQELQEVPKEGKRGEGTWIKLSGEREVDFNRTKLR
jgi:hypothetical protein